MTYLKTIEGSVIPAKAGIYNGIPAFAGMTGFVVNFGTQSDYHFIYN